MVPCLAQFRVPRLSSACALLRVICVRFLPFYSARAQIAPNVCFNHGPRLLVGSALYLSRGSLFYRGV